MFRTLLNRPRTIPNPEGSRVKDVYKAVTETDGNRRLQKVGERDLFLEIQSFEAETDISTIVARSEAAGRPELLKQREGAYVDLTVLPSNIHEAYKVIRNAESLYNAQSQDVRRSFGSFEGFLEAFQGDLSQIGEFFAKSNTQAQADPPQLEAKEVN